jgi:hypothetical protein
LAGNEGCAGFGLGAGAAAGGGGATGSGFAAAGTGCPMTPTFLTAVSEEGVDDVGDGTDGFVRSGAFFPFSWFRTVCTFCDNGDAGMSCGAGVETLEGWFLARECTREAGREAGVGGFFAQFAVEGNAEEPSLSPEAEPATELVRAIWLTLSR